MFGEGGRTSWICWMSCSSMSRGDKAAMAQALFCGELSWIEARSHGKIGSAVVRLYPYRQVEKGRKGKSEGRREGGVFVFIPSSKSRRAQTRLRPSRRRAGVAAPLTARIELRAKLPPPQCTTQLTLLTQSLLVQNALSRCGAQAFVSLSLSGARSPLPIPCGGARRLELLHGAQVRLPRGRARARAAARAAAQSALRRSGSADCGGVGTASSVQ